MTEQEATVRVTVKLFATFQEGRFALEERECAAGTTIREVVEGLRIPIPAIGVLLVNGRHVGLDDPLGAGDVLAVFPVIGGG